jgi:sialidase-1
LVLECSGDRGETFAEVLTLTDGPAAYSDLVAINNEQLLCAYETGAERPYERIDGVLVTSATAASV